ncbi:MAG: NosD domain-containing protein [Promethearchaeota archaeon]
MVDFRKVWAKDVLLFTILIMGITICEIADLGPNDLEEMVVAGDEFACLTRETSTIGYQTQSVYQRDSIDALDDPVAKSMLVHTLSEYTPQDPILINGDSEFNSTAQAEGWLGNGTRSNPFVISGLEILTDAESAISITGTTVYFVIRDCYLIGASYSVRLAYLSFGTIENIFTKESLTAGVFIEWSNNVTLSNVSCGDTEYGLSFQESNNITIRDSTCIANWRYGIDINHCSHGIVANNTLERNGRGIHIPDSSDIKIHGNCMWSCDTGLEENAQSVGLAITDNMFAFCYGDGLVLTGSNHSVVNNTFVHSIVRDSGTSNLWDDGVSQGNYWSDYLGTGWYSISGPAGSIDHHPKLYDPTIPMIDCPPDFEMDFYGEVEAIVWKAYDVDPGGYRILKNGTQVEAGLWFNPDSDFTYLLSGVLVGRHNFTLDVWDYENHHAYDTVWATITDQLPTINHPTDVFIDEGDEGQSITWFPAHAHPSYYEVKRNNMLFDSGNWNGSGITIDLFHFPPGVWDVTLTVWATSGSSVSDSMIVGVNNRPDLVPLIVGQDKLEIPESTEGYNLTWTVHGSYPTSYSIYEEDVVVESGTPTSRVITFAIPPGSLGMERNYKLVVSDSYGHYAENNVIVVFLVATTGGPPPLGILMTSFFVGGVGIILIVTFVMVSKRRKKTVVPEAPLKVIEEIPPYERAIEEPAIMPDTRVQVLRGAEYVGNRFRFKVKVLNNTSNVITDVTVTISSYPRDSLKLEGEVSRIVHKIDPEGFRSPGFEFMPTQDCVKGHIVASVSYVDHRGEVHSMATEPFTIRAVCDLLNPESITPEDYKLRISEFEHGEESLRVEEWTPEEMHEKTIWILRNSNFFEVESSSGKVGEHTEISISGWASGKYTRKNIGVDITITGRSGVVGSTCKVRMSSEDNAMILPAIDEISQKLGAWLCPRCGGVLPVESVRELKDGKSIVCPFCGVAMDR